MGKINLISEILLNWELYAQHLNDAGIDTKPYNSKDEAALRLFEFPIEKLKEFKENSESNLIALNLSDSEKKCNDFEEAMRLLFQISTSSPTV